MTEGNIKLAIDHVNHNDIFILTVNEDDLSCCGTFIVESISKHISGQNRILRLSRHISSVLNFVISGIWRQILDIICSEFFFKLRVIKSLMYCIDTCKKNVYLFNAVF